MHGCRSVESPAALFVLGGISVRDKGWNTTQEVFDKAIGDYFQGKVPANFELHAEELLSPYGDGPFSGNERERRNELVKSILGILGERRHDVHLVAIDKGKLSNCKCEVKAIYNSRFPYLVAYDYLITYINWFVKKQLGTTARGMIILDEKPGLMTAIDEITHYRRFQGPKTHRVKWVVEFSYAVDSRKNPMVQLSDLVVFCTKKFLELEAGYRDGWCDEAKNFYAECYSLIDARFGRKGLLSGQGGEPAGIDAYRGEVCVHPALR